MKLTLTCEHGTRTVEIEDGREGIGADHYAKARIAALMPECPYCSIPWQPVLIDPLAPKAAA